MQVCDFDRGLESKTKANWSTMLIWMFIYRVMSRLSRKRLKRLQAIWEEHPEGLEMADYIKLMLTEVPCSKEEKLELIHGLIKLFQQVDINGDQSM